jgi:hypothetical protein
VFWQLPCSSSSICCQRLTYSGKCCLPVSGRQSTRSQPADGLPQAAALRPVADQEREPRVLESDTSPTHRSHQRRLTESICSVIMQMSFVSLSPTRSPRYRYGLPASLILAISHETYRLTIDITPHSPAASWAGRADRIDLSFVCFDTDNLLVEYQGRLPRCFHN